MVAWFLLGKAGSQVLDVAPAHTGLVVTPPARPGYANPDFYHAG